MTKRDVDAGNFFVLQNVADDMRARDVRADGEFTHAIAVFVRAGVGVKLVAQIFIRRTSDARMRLFSTSIVSGVSFRSPYFCAKVIADHAIHHEDAVGV